MVKNTKRKLTKDEVAQEYIRIYNELGRLPTTRELGKLSKFCKDTFRNYLGNIEDIIQYCKLDVKTPSSKKHKVLSDDECLSILREANEECIKLYGRYITAKEIDANTALPSMDVYTRRFGGIDNVLNILGYTRELEQDILKQNLIDEYKEIAIKLGKTPTIYEYDKYCKIRKAASVSRIFGGFLEFQNICELDNNSHGKPKFDKNELLQNLHNLYIELDRKPTQQDIIDCGYLPSMHTIAHYFGSLTNALKEIGLSEDEIGNNKQITPNGTVCLSRYEYLFARMLEIHNIQFEKEVPYRKYIPNLKEWWKCDFEIVYQNENYFVEIFGITQTPSYDIKIKKKQLACKKNNIKLISIFPEDIMYKNYDKLYQMLKTKISHLTNYSFDDELDDLFDDM